MNKHLGKLFLAADASLLRAMQQMDDVRCKLLMVGDFENFIGLVSIGDIQRAIVRGVTLSARVSNIMRSNIVVCHVGDTAAFVKQELLRCRAEYMPILSRDGELEDVVFWDDVFGVSFSDNNRVKYDFPVVVMAGGKGTRLRPLTNILPKPLLPIGEKTIVETIMDQFCGIGCSTFYLSLNYKADMIERYLTENNTGAYRLNFYRETQPMGSGGSLSLLKGKLDKTFFVTNCDNILQQDLSEIITYHQENKNEMTVVAAVKSLKLPYGNLVTGKGERVLQIEEKPEFLFRVNTGVYLLEPHLLKEIPANQYYPITDLVTTILGRDGKVGCFPITDGSWCDIGNWGDYSSLLGKKI